MTFLALTRPRRAVPLAAASSPLRARARRLRRALPAALVVALALAGCGRKEAAPLAPRPVVAMPVQADAALPAWTLPGEVQARYSTPLSFRVGGKIVERLVRLGDAVTPGQIVARLDPADAARTRPAPAPSSRPPSTSWTTPSSSWTATAPRRART